MIERTDLKQCHDRIGRKLILRSQLPPEYMPKGRFLIDRAGPRAGPSQPMPSDRAKWECRSNSGNACFDSGGSGGIKAHQRVIAIEDHGLDVHYWCFTFLC